LQEAEREQAREDARLLVGALRGATGLAILILNQYTDGHGSLTKPTDLKDAAALLRISLSGRRWVDAGHEVEDEELVGMSSADIEHILRTGSGSWRRLCSRAPVSGLHRRCWTRWPARRGRHELAGAFVHPG
jgi:hypothetical protein